jgi:hypothetical protein
LAASTNAFRDGGVCYLGLLQFERLRSAAHGFWHRKIFWIGKKEARKK